jgi:hypothetical protein
MNKNSKVDQVEVVGSVEVVEAVEKGKHINNTEKIMKKSDNKKNGAVVNAAVKAIQGKKAGVGVGKGDASKKNEVPVLTEQQIMDLTENTVAQLNIQTDGECNARFERGRLIANYIGDVNKEGKPYQKFYKSLASHPASILKVQQIRYYHESYKLREKLETSLKGTDTNSLKLSHWVAVMPKELDVKDKVRLLQATVEKAYSVAQLQNEVKQQIDKQRKKNGTDKKPNLDKVTERFIKQSQSLFDSLSAMKDNAKESTDTAVTAQKAKINAEVKRIARFALKNGYLTIEELNNPQSETIQPSSVPIIGEKKEAA